MLVLEPLDQLPPAQRQHLLDLGVAVASGAAGAYALCRKEVSTALPGVAIATAIARFEPVTMGVSRAHYEDARHQLPDAIRVVEMAHWGRSSHVGSSLSMAELLAAPQDAILVAEVRLTSD